MSKNPNEPSAEIPVLWQKILLAVALVFIALFFVHKIIFVNADLGRHIKNGELILSGEYNIFSKNSYSYTEPDFPVVNHHWGSGVIYYLLWKFLGFESLTILNTLLICAASFIFYRIAKKQSGFIPAFVSLISAVPLLTGRTEIRPESFSYLFCGVFYYLLILFSEEKIALPKILFILLPLQLLWVNLHIFFILGIFLIGIFWLNSFFRKKQLKEFSILLSSAIVICLFNPNFISGFIEPFMIFREYGYMVAENQSLFFMHKRFPENYMYLHFEIAFLLLVLLFSFLFWKKGRAELFNPLFFIFLLFSAISLKMIRGIPLWGFFFVPFASSLFNNNNSPMLRKVLFSFAIVILFCGFFTKNNYYSPFKGYSGLGLLENVNRSAEFFKKNNIEGYVLNNYDIGGYLIFYFFPEEHIFVDNRPEAYSVKFFKTVYEPMQEKEDVWKEFSDKYNFNCIYFFRHDNTPHAQPFLIRRINDENWAPVFVDDFTIIFLKRNEKNSELIKKYELPKSMFSSVQQ